MRATLLAGSAVSSSETACATASRLRRLAPRTVQPAAARAALIVDPFGEGSTGRSRREAARTEAGERLTWPGRASLRPTASEASTAAANRSAPPGPP